MNSMLHPPWEEKVDGTFYHTFRILRIALLAIAVACCSELTIVATWIYSPFCLVCLELQSRSIDLL